MLTWLRLSRGDIVYKSVKKYTVNRHLTNYVITHFEFIICMKIKSMERRDRFERKDA